MISRRLIERIALFIGTVICLIIMMLILEGSQAPMDLNFLKQ